MVFTGRDDVDNMLNRYRARLLAENLRQNLISRSGSPELADRLIAGSLLPVRIIPEIVASPLLDIGSGGGLPGIPLKIVRPNLEVTLLDAKRSKTLFLKRVVRELGLEGVDVVWNRVESFAQEARNKDAFRTVVSRAVGDWPSLLTASGTLLANGGHLILWCTPEMTIPDHSDERIEMAGVFSSKEPVRLAVWIKHGTN
ncbi:MAG: 16S rRNA (guanine(527)-N(7))-methyltransferase RsmG [Calditrichaeota bacterium]|nr:16S rRNA (guanine(527)-N(7))-methyltransferase RsmG [Calditrichota bacterium]